MFLKQRKGYDTDEFYKDELIKKLRIEIENLKSQLKFETEISDGFVLNSGEYVVGNDLKTAPAYPFTCFSQSLQVT